MRIVRGFFGGLVLLGAAFMGGLATLNAGARHGWVEFRSDHLFGGEAFLYTVGAAAFTLLGVVLARTGRGVWTGVGILAAIGGVIAGAIWIVSFDEGSGVANQWAVAGVALVLIAVVALGRR